MRVLLLGNAPRSLINFRGPLIEALLARGHEVHAAAPFKDTDAAVGARLQFLGAAVHTLALQRTGMSVPSDLRALHSFVGILRRTAPDVVIAYTIKPVVYGMIAASLVGTKRRFAIITGLGYLFSDDKRADHRLTQLLARFLYKRAFSGIDKVFFQNVDDEALFRRFGILPGRLPSIVVNGSGVDTSLFSVVPFPGAPITFLMMARLIGAKGVREYAAAAAEVRRSHPDTRFLLAGGREGDRDSIGLGELAAWERDGTLEWLGRLDDVRPAIAAAHVLVLPSYYREGIPRSVLEAMAMGRPVITTDFDRLPRDGNAWCEWISRARAGNRAVGGRHAPLLGRSVDHRTSGPGRPPDRRNQVRRACGELGDACRDGAVMGWRPRRATRCAAVAAAAGVLFAPFPSEAGQGCIPRAMTRSIETAPLQGAPEYLKTFRDPYYGGDITLVTGSPGAPIPGLSGTNWPEMTRHQYSSHQAWNADRSLLVSGPGPDISRWQHLRAR